MKALSRAALVGTLATALAGLGLPVASLTTLAGSAAPVITKLELTPEPSDEGQQVVLHGDFTDADGPEEHYLVVSWGGQLALTQQSIPAGAVSFDVLKTYPDDRPTNTPSDTYDVLVILYDGSRLDPSMPNTSQTLQHTVKDVAPSVTVTLSATSITEGDSITASFSFTDPGTPDLFTETFDWGDGGPLWTQPTPSNVKSYSFVAHTFTLAGTYFITATARDDDTLIGTMQVRLTVNAKNTPPTDLRLTVTTVVEGDAATLEGSFTDPDKDDSHSVLVSWGDGSTDTTVPVDPGLLTFSTTHVYANHGDYTLTATVTDAASESTSNTAAVTVLGALTDELSALITSWNLDKGTQTSLLAKVDSARGNDGVTNDKVCSSLNALGNEVSAQTEKKLSLAQVSDFWALLAKVEAAVPCSSSYSAAAPRTPQQAPTRHN